MSARAFPWSLLGIAPTGDTKAIRGAYAAKIKEMDLDADVEGYARLRGARDTALRMAKAMAAQTGTEDVLTDTLEVVTEAPDLVEDAPPAWPHAAPLLPGAWKADPQLSTQAAPPEDAPLIARIAPDLTPGGDPAPHEQLAPPAPAGLTAPLLEGHEPANAVGTEALQSPFARLAAMLDPEGPEGVAPFDDAAEAQALALMGAVIDAVHHSPLDRQGEIENWIAGILADGWPRSAPLLEPANGAFGWEHEWGKLDARPAVEYLGARLRGYRFQRKVLQPGHRYHKAWLELTRPGRAGLFRHLRASGPDVRGLLHGVRKHFPELEDHFDAQRVASWEEASAAPTGLIILFGLIVMGVLMSLGDPRPQARTDSANPGADAISAQLSAAEDARSEDNRAEEDARLIDPVVAQAFGKGRDLAWLGGQQADLAWTIKNFAHNTLATNGNEEAARKAALNKLVEETRQLIYLNGRQTTGTDFERTMRLRLDLLEAARAQGVDTCIAYIQSGMLPGATPLPATVREREQELAASFAERKLLERPRRSGPTNASVPGALVEKVMKATGLSEERVAAAMGGRGSDGDRCGVTIALLDTTLRWKGDGRRAILLTL